MTTRDNTKRSPMMITSTTARPTTHRHWVRLINPVRAILTARAGSAPTELAFILGFVALVGTTGFVFVQDSLTDSYTNLSEQIEIASVNMHNPLGGGGSNNVANSVEESGGGSGSSGGSGGSNGGGNGNGNGNGNN